MKFCPECGTKLDGAKFCPECGTKINGTDTAISVNTQKAPEVPAVESTDERVIIKFSTYVFGMEGKKKNLVGNIDMSIPQENYTLTNERIIIEKLGVLKSKREEIELFKIKDVTFKQGMRDKMLGVGDITLVTTDETTPTFTFKFIKEPIEVRESIRTAVKAAKKSMNIMYRQDL